MSTKASKIVPASAEPDDEDGIVKTVQPTELAESVKYIAHLKMMRSTFAGAVQ